MDDKIDFVVTWLDSTDTEWQKEYNKYKGIGTEGDSSSARFRDWDLFRYWFRAVETYAPWVNKVFLITNGTFPKWINKNHPKLVLVRHSDYIPKEKLPTFNSCTIELYMNRIEGLSEHFVYFNDDCYLNGPITPDYYFRKGLPCDSNEETFFNIAKYNPTDRFNIFISMFVDVSVINRHFDRKKTVAQSKFRWFGPHLRLAGFATSLFFLISGQKRFVGFNKKHVEQPFLKSVWDEAWAAEEEMLTRSCTRFREDVILNPYFFRYWQFASNRFHPTKLNKTKKFRIGIKQMNLILRELSNKKTKSLCINDNSFVTKEQFKELKKTLRDALEKKFPKKSPFEL